MKYEEICAVCPGICKPACPVYKVLPRQPVSPQGIIRSIALFRKGHVEASELYNIFHCVACGYCIKACPIDNPVIDIILEARGRYGYEELEVKQPEVISIDGNRYVWIMSGECESIYLDNLRRLIPRLSESLTIIDASGIYRTYYLGNEGSYEIYKDRLVQLLDEVNADWIFTDSIELTSMILKVADHDIYLDIELLYHHIKDKNIALKENIREPIIYFSSCNPLANDKAKGYTLKILDMLNVEYIDGREYTHMNCCGAGGIYRYTNNNISEKMAKHLYNELSNIGGSILFDNWKCRDHLDRYINVSHLFEIMDLVI
jgi:Fe-S oxidoreductase